MHSDQIVPVVTTTLLPEVRAFYVDVLGLQLSFEHDRYLGVRAGAAGAPELGFMLPDADCPDTFAGKGITFSLRVADADAECERLRELGVTIVVPPTDMAWGSRAFLVVDPCGVMVLIGHPIPIAVDAQACLR